LEIPAVLEVAMVRAHQYFWIAGFFHEESCAGRKKMSEAVQMSIDDKMNFLSHALGVVDDAVFLFNGM